MMTRLLILGLSPIIVLMGTIAVTNTPALEWGGLSLAGALIYFFCKYLCNITEQHREERKELVSALEQDHKELMIIIKADTMSREKLVEALDKRPCLKGEDKIRQ